MSGDQETTQENPEETTPEDESSEMTIEDTKEQLATMYLNFLDKQKWGILATTAWLGVNLNPLQKDAVEYLTTDKTVPDKTDFFSNIGKNIKKKFVEKFTGWTMLEYNKASLNKMKALITQYKDDQTKLQELMTQIEDGIDPTIAAVAATTPVVADAVTPDTKVEYDDKTNREKVLTQLNKVIEEDKKDPINYLWWGKKDPEGWLDCSWLIYYTLDQAWLKTSLDSRSMFNDFDTKKLELKEWTHEVTTDVSDIQEGDIIRWNSTNKDYSRRTWAFYAENGINDVDIIDDDTVKSKFSRLSSEANQTTFLNVVNAMK